MFRSCFMDCGRGSFGRVRLVFDRVCESCSHSRPRVAGSGVSASYKSNGAKCTSFLTFFLRDSSTLFSFRFWRDLFTDGSRAKLAWVLSPHTFSFPSVPSLLLSSRSSLFFSRLLLSRRRPSQDGNRGENQSPISREVRSFFPQIDR